MDGGVDGWKDAEGEQGSIFLQSSIRPFFLSLGVRVLGGPGATRRDTSLHERRRSGRSSRVCPGVFFLVPLLCGGTGCLRRSASFLS